MKKLITFLTLLTLFFTTAWGDEVTLTQKILDITVENSYISGEKTVDGITYVYTDLRKFNTTIQVKGTTGAIYNSTAFPGNIASVAIIYSGNSPRATTIWGSSDGDEWDEVAINTTIPTTDEHTFTVDFEGKNYKFFKITRGASTAYWTKIIITYTVGGGDAGDIEEYVDLGLPTGTLWATKNIGASCPEEYGHYFAWGETTPKNVYDWETYKWSGNVWNTMTKYCTSSNYGTVDNKTELDPEDDAATANWGQQWCMPTKDQQDELLAQCTWEWTTRNGMKGYLVTSKKNSNWLFLPAAGYHDGAELYSTDKICDYWSSTLNTEESNQAYDIWCYWYSESSSGTATNSNARYFGFPVRPVRTPTTVWVLTDPSELKTDDVVLIVDKTSKRAMSNDKGTSAAPSATSVTLNSDLSKVIAGVTTALQWNVTNNNGTFNFTVPSSGYYLYTNNSNDGVRVGSSQNAIYNHDFTINNNFLYNTATSRYLGVYNNQDWRCYTSTSTNIQNTKVAFYKKVDLGAHSVTVGTITGEGSITPSTTSANPGDVITVTATPATGYELTALAYNDNAIALVEGQTEYTFTMPDEDVTLTAIFSKIDYNIYRTIKTDGNVSSAGGWLGNWSSNCTLPNGAVGDSYVVTTNYGETVQFKAGTKNGYQILESNVTAVDANYSPVTLTKVSSDDSGITFSFTMPANPVTITANFTTYQPNLYLLGTANEVSEWTYTGPQLTYDGTKYSIDVYFKGASENDKFGYFSFTTKGDAQSWNDLTDKRIGAKDGDKTEINAEHPVKEMDNNSNAFKIPAGLYTIEVNSARTQVTIIPKDVTFTFDPSAGNAYVGTEVTVSSNLYSLLHAINSNLAENAVTNEVSLDGSDFSENVTLNTIGEVTVTGKASYAYITPTATALYTVQEIQGDVYTLVESATDLVAGGEYVLMSKGLPTQAPGYAMAGQTTNNRKQTVDAISVNSNNEIIINGQVDDAGNPVQVITLEGQTGAWYLNVENGYLYAAGSAPSSGSGNNYLRTETEKDNNAKATITIDSNSKTAAIVFQGTNTNRYLRHNASSEIFSCYGSTSQQAVYLFKKTSSTPPSDQVATPTFDPGSADSSNPYIVYGGKQEITINCATSGATIYYTTDGTTPTTSSIPYAEPCYLTSTGGNVTVKAIAVKDGLDDSEVATSYYLFTNPNPPTFNPASGTVHNDAFNVTISSEYEDAVIYYMLDPASAPTAAQMSESGTLYENPVKVSGEGSHTIYAMVVRNGIKSNVVNASYTIASSEQPTVDGDYVKVTKSEDLTDGEYLIVYEMEGESRKYGYLFNGALSKLDVTGNTYAGEDDLGVNIYVDTNNNNTIVRNDDIDAAIFTIDVKAGTIKSASGYYIGQTSDANGLISSTTTTYENSISIDNDGNAVIISSGAHLRFNADPTQIRFRYYKSSSITNNYIEPIALYKKIEKPIEISLAALENPNGDNPGKPGKPYTISDKLLAVKCVDDGHNVYLFCKDEGPSFAATENTNNYEDYMKVHGGFEGEWDQSNWIALVFEGLDSKDKIKGYENKYIEAGTVTGYYINNESYALRMETTDLKTVAGEMLTYPRNLYCPANFLTSNQGADGVHGNSEHSTDKYYFFMNPKIQEVCEITFAVWNGEYFVLPAPQGVMNDSNIPGAFYAEWIFNDNIVENPETGENHNLLEDLVPGVTYRFDAIVQTRLAKKAGAPSLKDDSATVTPGIYAPDDAYTICPVDFDPKSPDNIVTSINTVATGNGEVKSVKYVNVAGIVSDRPFQGVNIVVTEYTDGSRTTSKMLKK